jgi:opacity protein-like surface antigen
MQLSRLLPHTLFLLAALVPSMALAELELKSVAENGEALSKKRNFGPYVGVYAGESLGQTGKVTIQGRSFPLEDLKGSALFGIQVGKSWKMKRLPIMLSAQFDGVFSSTSLKGSIGNFNGGAVTNDVVSYEADMNSLLFNLGGSVSLDLYRYRARLGKVLAGFRPYAGAGIGGGQVWFRNATARSDSQANHGGTLAPAATPFTIDEFISSWNWYAGLEWSWEDRYSVFAEYRDFQFGDLENLTNYQSDGYVLGFRYRY